MVKSQKPKSRNLVNEAALKKLVQNYENKVELGKNAFSSVEDFRKNGGYFSDGKDGRRMGIAVLHNSPFNGIIKVANVDKVEYVKFDEDGRLKEVLTSDPFCSYKVKQERIEQLKPNYFKIESKSYDHIIPNYKQGGGFGYEYLLNKYGVQTYKGGIPDEKDFLKDMAKDRAK